MSCNCILNHWEDCVVARNRSFNFQVFGIPEEILEWLEMRGQKCHPIPAQVGRLPTYSGLLPSHLPNSSTPEKPHRYRGRWGLVSEDTRTPTLNPLPGTGETRAGSTLIEPGQAGAGRRGGWCYEKNFIRKGTSSHWRKSSGGEIRM
jgi:hypothetical protein